MPWPHDGNGIRSPRSAPLRVRYRALLDCHWREWPILRPSRMVCRLTSSASITSETCRAICKASRSKRVAVAVHTGRADMPRTARPEPTDEARPVSSFLVPLKRSASRETTSVSYIEPKVRCRRRYSSSRWVIISTSAGSTSVVTGLSAIGCPPNCRSRTSFVCFARIQHERI